MASRSRPQPEVFTPAYQKLVPDLLEVDWTPDEGISVQEFSEQLADSPAAEEMVRSHRQLEVPVALRQFYLALGNCDEILETDHFFFAPDEFDLRDEHLMFLEDADESTVWGVAVDQLSLPDPLVSQRSTGADAQHGQWRQLGGTVSEIILDLFAWMTEDTEEQEEQR